MIYALLCSILVFISGCDKGPERTLYRGGTSHLPLLHDRVLRYEEQRAGKTTDVEVTMRYAGGRGTKVYPLRIEGADWGHCELLSADSIVYFITSNPLTALERRGTLLEYRELWLNETVAHGDAWQNHDTGTQTVFAGYETVQTPAGSFADCYKAVTAATQELHDSLQAWHERGAISNEEFERESANANLVVVRWFAPGVGLVKEKVGEELVRVLVEVAKAGKGLVDTARVEPTYIAE